MEQSLLSALGLVLLGALAGFIDSIAGGGGLISLPTVTLAVGPGAIAVGTNKVAAVVAASVALLVYMRAGHFEWRRGLAFALWVAAGSALGSMFAPRVSPQVFKILILVICPIILWVVWRKDLWIAREARVVTGARRLSWLEPGVVISGLVCGFYDGIFGPGGGTFMFLSLLFFARLPLLSALASAKFANACSALAALSSFAAQGYVRWQVGAWVACGIGVGAFLGANFATRKAARIVRPMLVVSVMLLLMKILVSR